MASKKSIGKEQDIVLNKQQTGFLIDLYEDEPDLWNVFSPNYHRKQSRGSALNRIQERMMREFQGFYISIKQLRTKLYNIRGYYSKELAKLNKSMIRAGVTGDIYRSPWSHFDALDKFLRAQVVPRSSLSFLEPKKEPESMDEDEDDDESNATPQCLEAWEDIPDTPPRSIKRKVKIGLPESTAGMAETVPGLSSIKDRNPEREVVMVTKEDDESVFGRHVANEIRRMEDPRTKAFVKYQIQSLIFEAQFGNLAQSQAPVSTQDGP